MSNTCFCYAFLQDAIKMQLSKGRMTLKEVAAAIRMAK